MKKYKCLVIGLGKISMFYDAKIKTFLTHCKSIKKHNFFELVGGVDKDLKKKVFFEKKFKSKFYSNLNEALNKCSPDVIIIATNTNTHYQVFKEIIKKSKPKIILFEKPLTPELSKSEEIIKLAKIKKIKVFVNYTRISDVSSKSISKIIQNSPSKEFKIFVHYSKGLYNSCSHFISLVKFWFKDIGKIKWKKKIRSIEKIKDIDVDFKLSTKNTEIEFTSTKYENYSHNSIIIFGNDFKIEYMHNGTEIKYFKRVYDRNLSEYNLNFVKFIKNNFDEYQLNVYNNLHNFFLKKKYQLFNGDESLKIEKIFNKLK